jgi:long-chain acyl-CoA synthetase
MTLAPARFLPLTSFISRNAQWYPEKTAIIFENQKLTWKAFDERANRVANHLHQAGISKGDRVVVLSQNCLEYPEIMFGTLKAGAVVVPVSTLLKKETVLLELQDAQPKAIFAGHSFLHLAEGYESTVIRTVLEGSAHGWISYDSFLQGGLESEPGIILSADDFYNVVYSSGTTGNPKGIVHTHQARILFAMTCGLEFRIHNDAISLISTPIYTNGTQLIYLPTVLVGGTLVLMRTFNPPDFLKLVEQEKCTHAFLVPTQFIGIMEQPNLVRYDTSSIEVFLSAAAPLRKRTKNEILTKFTKSKLVELYGVTEGISTVLRPNEQFSKLGSVGKPRLGGDIKILDEKGNELPRGSVGEIAGSNFSMMAEYYRNPEETAEALWYDQRGSPYVKTGDIGRLDAEGYLYILDRKKDMIVSGGINIFPSDLEETLLVHPAIAEAAVIGVPHEKWGESPLALVVKKNPESPITESELKEWANSRLAGYQKLAGVEFRPSLPKNDLGKILKSELRKPYWTASDE